MSTQQCKPLYINLLYSQGLSGNERSGVQSVNRFEKRKSLLQFSSFLNVGHVPFGKSSKGSSEVDDSSQQDACLLIRRRKAISILDNILSLSSIMWSLSPFKG